MPAMPTDLEWTPTRKAILLDLYDHFIKERGIDATYLLDLMSMPETNHKYNRDGLED